MNNEPFKIHPVIPVVPDTICVDRGCNFRTGISPRSVRVRQVKYFARIASGAILAFMLGAIVCLSIVSAQHLITERESAQDAVNMKSEYRLNELEARIKLAEDIAQTNRESIAVIHGVGIAAIGLLAILQGVQIIAAMAVRRESLISTVKG